MDFSTEFKRRANICNDWINELSPKGDGYHRIIYDAANYSVNAGGKRIRPVLAYSVCDMLSNNVDSVKHFACALEFIHTYSLIHDDLPCMDNDELRRGIPTNHIKYGEAIALLAGDALLNYAFETALKSETSADVTIKALRILSDASGINGMIGGQVIDISGINGYDELLTVHNMKTGALIKAAASIGAVIGGADYEQLKAIIEYSENLGLAFQIKDDILDVVGNEEILGKTIGSDEILGKTTFVSIFGVDGAKFKLDEYTDKAKSALGILGDKAWFLQDLADYLLRRDS